MSDAHAHLSQTVSAKHHEGFDVGGGEILPAGMKGHTDAEMDELLKLRH